MMIDILRELLSSITQEKCQFCNEVIENGKITAEVKIPGYTGNHTRHFCSQRHLEAWKNYIREWEKKNHKIPIEGNCPTCTG